MKQWWLFHPKISIWNCLFYLLLNSTFGIVTTFHLPEMYACIVYTIGLANPVSTPFCFSYQAKYTQKWNEIKLRIKVFLSLMSVFLYQIKTQEFFFLSGALVDFSLHIMQCSRHFLIRVDTESYTEIILLFSEHSSLVYLVLGRGKELPTVFFSRTSI